LCLVRLFRFPLQRGTYMELADVGGKDYASILARWKDSQCMEIGPKLT